MKVFSINIECDTEEEFIAAVNTARDRIAANPDWFFRTGVDAEVPLMDEPIVTFFRSQ